MAPILVADTKSHSLDDAMRNHPLARPLWSFAHWLLISAKKLGTQINTIDDAISNGKTHQYQVVRDRCKLLLGRIRCMSHQNQLGYLNMILAVFRSTFFQQMYLSAKFFNLSNHRLRCIMCTPQYIRQWIRLKNS